MTLLKTVEESNYDRIRNEVKKTL